MRTRMLRVKNRRNETVGYIAVVQLTEMSVRFGYSLCNPKDRFNSEQGRKIALARAGVTRHDNEIVWPKPPEGFNTMFDTALQVLSNNMEVPHTIRSFAKRRLDRGREHTQSLEQAAQATLEQVEPTVQIYAEVI